MTNAQARLDFGAVYRKRKTKREQIIDLFSAHLGVEMATSAMHAKFGSAFRTRVSEINRSKHPILIRNRVTRTSEGEEHSVYWSEVREDAVVVSSSHAIPEGSSLIDEQTTIDVATLSSVRPRQERVVEVGVESGGRSRFDAEPPALAGPDAHGAELDR